MHDEINSLIQNLFIMCAQLNIHSKVFILLSVLLSACFGTGKAQKTIAGFSEIKSSQTPVYVKDIPPNLFADLEFIDENSNDILEADETAEIKLSITNKGKGVANKLIVSLTNENNDSHIILPGKKVLHFLYPGQTTSVVFTIAATHDIPSSEYKIRINVSEYSGYDMDAAYLIFNSLEYQSPELSFNGYEIIDSGSGTSDINPDGKLQPGELVKLRIYIQNIGKGIAKKVEYKVLTNDSNVYTSNTEGDLKNILVGEVKDFWVSLSPNKRININDDINLHLKMVVDHQNYLSFTHDIPVLLNEKPPQTRVLNVKPDTSRLNRQLARFEYSPTQFFVPTANITNVPLVEHKRKNAFGIIIGIENYENLPPATYAENDALIVKRYFTDVLGIERLITLTSEAARGFVFENTFNPQAGDLRKYIIPRETDLFVYYSGHGVPSKGGDTVYLMPADGKLALVQKQGYEMNKFLSNLDELNTKSTTVFLDACFSGSSKPSKNMPIENLTLQKGIRIKPKIQATWEKNPNFSIFTSSGFSETSLAYDESGTGLFTYFVCLGLQGKADENQDKKITTGELFDYVKKSVHEKSAMIYDYQTPEFHGNKEMVLVEY